MMRNFIFVKMVLKSRILTPDTHNSCVAVMISGNSLDKSGGVKVKEVFLYVEYIHVTSCMSSVFLLFK